MNLSLILLILIAIAVAEAALALRDAPERGIDVALMGAILLIAVALVLLDMTAAVVVATDPPIG